MSEPVRQGMQPPKVERIGRYTVERFLARGGMAEVFLGKAEGPGGFAKSVVIKRIHPDLSQEDRFVSMFLDEARLAAQLSHPNIVQVFDFGEQDGLYFIAMEYIQGESLRAILRSMSAMGKKVPPRLAAGIVSGVCEGLHYAHQLTDEGGTSANVIHRDVTPDNILISNSGIPKLVDFGIAKASTHANRTENGMLKGKYGYMSPEQIKGENIDHRLDVYALGVTLYEVLAGHRPYRAENELQLMREILAAKAPPLNQLNPEVPELLADVVANAMSADPDLRYHDAHSFQAGLEEYLHGSGHRVSNTDIAELVREVTTYRRARDPGAGTQHTPSVHSSPGSGPKAGAPKSSPGAKLGSGPKPQPTPSKLASPPRAALPDLSDDEEVEERTKRMDLDELLGPPAREDATRRVSLADMKALADPAPAPAPPPAPSTSLADLVMAPVEIDPDPVPELDAEGTKRQLAPEPPTRLGASPIPPPLVEHPEATPTDRNAPKRSGRPGWLIPAAAGGAFLLLAGAGFALLHGSSAPQAAPAPVAAHTDPKPEPVKPPEPKPEPKPEAVVQAEPKPEPKPEPAKPAPAKAEGKPGYLTVKAEKTCDVYVDGQKLGQTPLPKVELAAGKHELVVKNASAGIEKKYSVEVPAGGEATKEVTFGKGKLEVKVQPWAKVTVDGKDVGTTPFPALDLAEGSHKVVLSNPELQKTETRTVKLKAGGKEVLKVIW